MKTYWILLLLSMTVLTNAQNLEQLIPQNAAFVASVHPETLNAKVNLKELQQYQFYDMMMMQIGMTMNATSGIGAALMADESLTGINLMKSFHTFGQMDRDYFKYGMVFQLSDNQKLKDYFFGEGEWKDTEINRMNGFDYAMPDDNKIIGWNEEFVLMTSIEKNTTEAVDYIEEDYYDFDEEEYDETSEELKEESEAPDFEELEEPFIESPEATIDEETQLLLRSGNLAFFKECINRDPATSILTNKNYGKAKNKFSDQAHLYVDYGWLMDFMQEMQQAEMPGIGGYNEALAYLEVMQGMMGSLYSESGLSVGMNFNKGDMEMDMRFFMNEKMKDLTRKMYDRKFNKRFAKYIKGEELIGIWNWNMSTKGMIEGYKEIAMSMAAETPIYGAAAKSGLELIGILIDEEAIANVFTGNALLAVTGMQEVTKMVTTYEYDEEFNATEIQKEVTENMPEMTMMLSYGNEKDVMKFIRLGINSTFLEQTGTYYTMHVPEFGAVYIALKDGIFFLTNDADLINNLNKGYPKKQRVDKALCKLMMDNASYLYWDIPNTMNAANAEESANAMGAGEYVNLGKQNFKSFTLESPREVTDYARSTFKFNLTNKNENSLKVLFNFIDEVFGGMMGGRT